MARTRSEERKSVIVTTMFSHLMNKTVGIICQANHRPIAAEC